MRKFTLLVAGVALAAGTLSACFGGGPPPTDPHDVLVVGDSVSFSFGCALGNDGGAPQDGCPARQGYTTVNEFSGACTITPGQALLYATGQTVGTPNCNTAPDEHGRTWDQASSFFVPKVVVINTAGWEVVDRWITRGGAPPDAQWGGPTNGPSNDEYHTASAYYSNELFNAINMFRSRGAKVLLSLSPYFAPPTPEPPPGSVPAGLECSWWEPYEATAPISAGPCQQGQAWQSPPGAGTSYRSSKTKVDQFNGIVNFVKSQYFPTDSNVQLFRFDSHFNGPQKAYTTYVCPPPYDTTVQAKLQLDLANPPNQAWKCQIGAVPASSDPYAILARAPDNGHLSVPGTFQILQPYLEGCVQNLLGIGGKASDCA